MDEFSLIDCIVDELGDRAQGQWVCLGPGDDAAVISHTSDHQTVASIDTLVADAHFPADAPADLIGYRAVMVSLSDLAAMAATPRYVLVALTLPNSDPAWVTRLARGMAQAARATQVYVCGGNLSRGALSITVSVHGEVPHESAVTRSGAQAGEGIYVSGQLGGAAACVRLKQFEVGETLSVVQKKYFQPRARIDLVSKLRKQASACIDISDGFLQDLSHLTRMSGVGAQIESSTLPLCEGATLDDALYGGDDYELLCTSATPIQGLQRVGMITAQKKIVLDDEVAYVKGYEHFTGEVRRQ